MDLLTMAIDEHGGMRRWEQISRFRAAASITGDLWKHYGQDGMLDDVVVEGEARDQRVTITPFPEAGRYATWEPHRQMIKTDDGVPTEMSHKSGKFTSLRAVHLAAQACWNQLTSPFLLARADFVTREIGGWREDGQDWNRLAVTYPRSIAVHTRRQTWYFDNSGFLCRIDYRIDLLGGAPLVHYPLDYCEFDGILVPMRHRVYARTADQTADLSTTLLALDFHDVVFS
jgi:hypothetical protein